MNNTANGGRKCKVYTKDGIINYVRFVMVNNSRTLTTYCNVWIGDTKLGQTCDCAYKNSAKATKLAEKMLSDHGYIE